MNGLLNGYSHGLNTGLGSINPVGLGHGLVGDDAERNFILRIPNLMAWYDVNSLNVDYSNKVSRLIDKSGQGRHMTMGTPVHILNVPQSRIACSLSTTGFLFPYTMDVSNFSLFMVMSSNNNSPRFGLFQEASGSYTIHNILIQTGGAGSPIEWHNTSTANSAPAAPAHKDVILEFHGEKNNFKRIIQNGVQVMNVAFGNNKIVTNFTFLGGYYYAENDGTVKEIVLFNNRLSEADKLKVRNILNKKHKIY